MTIKRPLLFLWNNAPKFKPKPTRWLSTATSTYGDVMYASDWLDPSTRKNLSRIRKLQDIFGNQNEIDSLFAKFQSTEKEKKCCLTMTGYKGGLPTEQINQDRAFVLSPFRLERDERVMLLGVFDGHSEMGELVSEYAVHRLPDVLGEKLDKGVQPETALVDSFLEIDRTIPSKKGGCSASVVLQIHDRVYIANAGDSKSAIATYCPDTKQTEVVYTSREDKPHLPEEKARIEAAGGKVYIPSDKEDSSRVLQTDPDTGIMYGLAMSRSIGDRGVKSIGVIAEPVVDKVDIQRDKKIFAFSATDGMLDYVSEENIARIMAPFLYEDEALHPMAVCEDLVVGAALGWEKEFAAQYRDDISIALCDITIP